MLNTTAGLIDCIQCYRLVFLATNKLITSEVSVKNANNTTTKMSSLDSPEMQFSNRLLARLRLPTLLLCKIGKSEVAIPGMIAAKLHKEFVSIHTDTIMWKD